MRKNSNKGCKDECSYLIEEYDFDNLEQSEQTAIIQAIKGDAGISKLDASQLKAVFIDTLKGRCIGGLLEKDDPYKKSCKFYNHLPPSLSLTDLVSSFNLTKTTISQKKWQLATLFLGVLMAILAVLSLLLGWYSFKKNKEIIELQLNLQNSEEKAQNLEEELNKLKQYIKE